MNSAAEGDGSADLEVDPFRVTTAGELAAALRALRLRGGEPSLRELERRGRSRAAVAAGRVPLSRTTLSGVLNGDRFPSHEVLVALLSAMGVVGYAEQRAWTAARERLVRLRDQPESAPPVAPIGSQRRRRRRWAAGAVLLAVILIIAVIVTVLRPSAPATNTLTATMGCVPASCAAHGPTLVLRGRLNGSVPPDSRVVVMILVDNTQRWYLGPTVGGDDVEWTREIGIGNRVPQPRIADSRCAYTSSPPRAWSASPPR